MYKNQSESKEYDKISILKEAFWVSFNSPLSSPSSTTMEKLSVVAEEE